MEFEEYFGQEESQEPAYVEEWDEDKWPEYARQKQNFPGDLPLHLLTPKQRLVVSLHLGYIDGYRYSYRQIGRIMGIKHQTAMDLFGRGAATLSLNIEG